MRERILKSIYKIIDSEEPQDEETINHLQRQITLLNKASICTIDSFCLDVIKKNNFFEIEISPNFRIADTAEIDLLKQEVLEKIIRIKKNMKIMTKTLKNYIKKDVKQHQIQNGGKIKIYRDCIKKNYKQKKKKIII